MCKKSLLVDSLRISIFILNKNDLTFRQDIKFKEDPLNFSNYVFPEFKYFLLNKTQIVAELMLSIDKIKSINKISEKEKFKIQQYLRQFSFFYQLLILRKYPNSLSDISCKKINTLAIKNLYLLNSL